MSVASGVDVSILLARDSVVAVVLSPSVLLGNGALANADGVSRSANSPLATSSRRAKMNTVKRSIRDAFLIPSCFTVTPASFP